MQTNFWLLTVTAAISFSTFTSRGAHPLPQQRDQAPGASNASSPATLAPPAEPGKSKNPLVWDQMEKTILPTAGDVAVEFTFWATNTSKTDDVIVNELSPSCGCTTPKTELPWKLTPGASGPMHATVDIKGKSGNLEKTITVDSTAGTQVLTLKINVPLSSSQTMSERQANMERAKSDRQAIFKGSCIDCHLVPAINKTGEDLYVAGCAICHEPNRWAASRKDSSPHHRAEMVPDLANLKQPLNREAWKSIIGNGKPNTLMPAFSQRAGGILTDQQIDSLAEYVTKRFAAHPTPSAKTEDTKKVQ